jgi:hypothetical protein
LIQGLTAFLHLILHLKSSPVKHHQPLEMLQIKQVHA